MKRKDIQINIQEILYTCKGSSDKVEIFGNVGISYNTSLNYIHIVSCDAEASTKFGYFSYNEYFIQEEETAELFGDILNNSQRVRQNKIRKYLNEVNY